MRWNLAAVALLSVSLAAPALAAGEIELNHTCATTTGCLVGDAPGYPIQASQRGSYRLTSNLVVPAGTGGIVFAGGASLDLAGFTVAGPVTCPLGACPAVSAGVGILGGDGNAITNGRVSGFANDCIEVGRGSRVERVNVTECAQHGIVAGGGSYVASNQVDAIGKTGIQFLVPTSPPSSAGVYRDNTIGVTGVLSVENGRASGPNTCLDQKCGTTGKKLAYITPAYHTGGAAPGACAPGFHMAAFSEIRNLEDFEWDETRGGANADSGQGVADSPGYVWVRTGGNAAFNPAAPGYSNCDAYTSSAAVFGSAIAIDNQWTTVSPNEGSFPGWQYRALDCNSPIQVWCMQD